MLTGIGALLEADRKFIVYTALTGRYEKLNEIGVFEQSAESAYYCISDDEELISHNWNIIHTGSSKSKVQKSREIKMLFPKHLRDGTICCYKDNTVSLNKPVSQIAEEMLGNYDLVFLKHYSRASIFWEFVVCEAYNKDTKIRLRAHFLKIVHGDRDVLWEKPVWGGFFVLRVNKSTRHFLSVWHDQYLNGSARDQLSLVSALRECEVNYCLLDVSNRLSCWHRWPVEVNRYSDQSKKPSSILPARIKVIPQFVRSWIWYFGVCCWYKLKRT